MSSHTYHARYFSAFPDLEDNLPTQFVGRQLWPVRRHGKHHRRHSAPILVPRHQFVLRYLLLRRRVDYLRLPGVRAAGIRFRLLPTTPVLLRAFNRFERELLGLQSVEKSSGQRVEVTATKRCSCAIMFF